MTILLYIAYICMGFDITEMLTTPPASPWPALPLSLLSPFFVPCFVLRRASWLVCCPTILCT